MIEVIPAILENNFSEIERKIHLVKGLVDWVQIDLLDGTLMPNSNFSDPVPFARLGSDLKRPEGLTLEGSHPLNFELHLMVKDPLRYIDNFAKTGFKRFFTHVEGDHIDEFIEKCYGLGVEAGLAIDGPTEVGEVIKHLDDIDAVLVMAIDAGFSGMPFREDTIEKIKKIRAIDPEIPIAVDGAMNDVNAIKVVRAGATRINSNSYIFGSTDVKMAIEKLKNLK